VVCDGHFCVISMCRVLEQHSLSKEEWQEKVVNWHTEHKGLMRLSTFHRVQII